MGQDKANPLATILSSTLMLDYLANKKNCSNAAKSSKLIETTIEVGFRNNKLRPMEFGGDMGTQAITKELMDLLKDKNVQQEALN
jgi:3-isopropylmalate dehydrogenase